MNVIVVCTGNSCRSPIAEGLLKKIFHDYSNLTILSAGTAASPGTGASAEAIIVAQELGADIRQHTARQIDQSMMDQAALVIAVTQAHALWLKQHFPENQEKILTLGELARGDASLDISDPLGYSLETYRRVAAEMNELLREAYVAILEKLHIRENKERRDVHETDHRE